MMLKKTDTRVAPWHIVRSDDKRTARLNTIAHLLSLIPYKKLPQTKMKLPKRSTKGAYDDDASIARRRFVRERLLGSLLGAWSSMKTLVVATHAAARVRPVGPASSSRIDCCRMPLLSQQPAGPVSNPAPRPNAASPDALDKPARADRPLSGPASRADASLCRRTRQSRGANEWLAATNLKGTALQDAARSRASSELRRRSCCFRRS